MKRLLALCALLIPLAFAQGAGFTLEQALEIMPEDGRIVLVTAEGEIVGGSGDLARGDLEVYVSEGFSGSATLHVLAEDGTVLFSFEVAIEAGGVTVDGEALASVLAASGYVDAEVLATVELPEEAAGEVDLPDEAGGDAELPDAANDNASEGADNAGDGIANAPEEASEGADEADDAAHEGAGNADGAGSPDDAGAADDYTPPSAP